MKKIRIHAFCLCLALTSTAYSQKKIPNYARANLVLGQDNFASKRANNVPSAFSFTVPGAVMVDPVSRKVFVADINNGRILRFQNANSLTNGAVAEAVFGKPNFSATGSTTGQQGLSGFLRGLFLDHRGRLWVADLDNNRILCYEAAVYRSSSPFADKVIGQPNFSSTSDGTTASKLKYPQGVCVDLQDRLWVADNGNKRVLRFDAITAKSNGAAANGVLGQPDFVTTNSETTINSISSPVGLAVNSAGALFVGDYVNHRVLRFNNAAALPNGANASAVLGQPDFTTSDSGLSATSMNYPCGVFWTPNDDLWVWDTANNRILRFEKASTLANVSPARGVVGQPNFTTSASGLSDRAIRSCGYFGFVDSTGSLWTPDADNNRVLRYAPDITPPALKLTVTVPKETTTTSFLFKGTASDAYGVAKVQYKIGSGALKTASGTTSWQFQASLAFGTNTITIYAVDAVGNLSPSKVIIIKRVANKAPQLLLSVN